MKKLIMKLLCVLYHVFETMGWFFMYAWLVYKFTDGAMVGNLGVFMMTIASVASALGLFVAVLKWGD